MDHSPYYLHIQTYDGDEIFANVQLWTQYSDWRIIYELGEE